jgi:hypothetical protein
MKIATAKSIFGRSSEGRASLRRSAGLGLADLLNRRRIAHRSDLASARPFLSGKGSTFSDRLFASVSVPTEPCPCAVDYPNSEASGGEVRGGNTKRHSLGDVGRIEDSRSGRNLYSPRCIVAGPAGLATKRAAGRAVANNGSAFYFPAKCDLSSENLRMTTCSLTSPAASRRVVAGGRN